MKWKGLIIITLLMGVLSCGSREVRLPMVPDGLIELSDTVSLGIPRLPDAERILAHASDGPGYVNNVLLTSFGGKYYCMWQSSLRDEDTPDTQVLYAISADGHSWDTPSVLACPTDSTFVSPGGWIQRGDSLTAILNYVCAPDRSKGGTAWFASTRDGRHWSAPQPVRMADGAPVQGIFEQDPLLLPGGRTVGAVHFRPGLRVNPVYTDDPSALRGWKASIFPEGEGSPLEPSQYAAPDGSLVMLFRDQASSFVKLASVSTDCGESWSAPARTIIPDSRSKQCAGTLPDDRTFWVGNPTGNKSRRILVLTLSEDGYCFDKAFLLASPDDLPPKRYEGRYKTLGYNYPKATVIGTDLWISLSVNKEDAVLFRIPWEKL
jgi:hypothetical protein